MQSEQQVIRSDHSRDDKDNWV